MSKKITSQDIFDDKIFDKIKSDANSFKTTLEGLKTQFTAILQQQQQFLQQKVSFASAADLKKLNDVLEQNKNLRKALTAIQAKLNQVQQQSTTQTKELTKEKVRESEARKRKRKELVDEIALENKQNKTLNVLLAQNRKLRRERADLNVKTAEGRKRIAEINVQLDKNNKLIRQNADTLKKQRLNVGNYTSALGRLGSTLRSIAGAFGLVTGAAALVSVFKGAVNIFKDFEQVQTDLASILQKSRAETEALSEAAQDLGATTFFTATEVSKLQVELAKLGFDTQQIVDSEEAILDLAAAFSIELPRAAKIVASTLNGFQLDASESGRVADVLAKSFAKSALDIEKFEVAISKVAPIAKGLNVDIETTTAALGKLVSAGFDASTAGTQFRNILLKLSNPASELANTLGITVDSSDDLVQAFKTLNKEQLSIAEAQGLIDVRSVALLKSLSDNADGVQDLRVQLEGAAGTAKDIASNQLKTLNGSFRLLSSAYEGFILSLDDGGGAISQVLKDISALITGVFNLLTNTDKTRESFSALKPEIQDLATRIVNFFKAVKSAAETLFEYRRIIIATAVALKAYQVSLVAVNLATGIYQKATVLARIATIAFSGGVTGLTRAMKLLNISIKSNPIGLLASALAVLGSVLVTFLADWLLFGETTDDVNEKLEKNNELIKKSEERVRGLKKALGEFSEIRNIFQDVLTGGAEALLKASDPELSKALQEANDRLAESVRKIRVENNNLSENSDNKYTPSIKARIKELEGEEAVLRKIIGSIKGEQKARKESIEGVGGEIGKLNSLRNQLRKSREDRDNALTEGDIEKENIRIGQLQDEIKRLEELGETAEQTKKKLDKLRSTLDKLEIRSIADLNKAFSDIDTSVLESKLNKLGLESKDLDDSLGALSDTLSDDSAFVDTKGRGLFFTSRIISKKDLDGILEDVVEFSNQRIEIIKKEAELREQALVSDRKKEETDIEKRRALRDSELKARLKALEDLNISDEDRVKETDRINNLLLESEKQFYAEWGALQEDFKNSQSEISQESKEEIASVEQEKNDIITDSNNKRFDIIRDKLLEEIDLYGDYVQEIISLTEQKVARQNELERQALTENTRLREKDADRQFQRAIRGQENIFAFQENLAAKARARELDAQKKAAQKERALQLTSAYFEALQARLAEAVVNENLEKKGDNRRSGVTSGNAALFALKDTFLADALSSVVAGAFATGVEDFKGKGTGTSDSNLIAFSHGESVVTAKGTKQNKGLVTAMNEGKVDEYFRSTWLPKFQMDNSPSLIANFVNKDSDNNNKLAEKLDRLTDIMANKPVQQVHVDSFGNIIETSYRDGLKTVIKHKAKKRL